ncbi:hypothetical protein MCOLE_v1c02580 [Mesoplasma coleopterae]|uniref:Uncharacterized protein n=1 Tax=Mesoplasma coleopterae TaxID=324078 RepID=A0A2K8P1Z4_9MOLU|nr:hypothetical protein MCOLE_v1c02580 [Mesoplasma coleopterae]
MNKLISNNFFKILVLYFTVSFFLPQLGFLVPLIVVFSLFYSIFKVFKEIKIKPKFMGIFFILFFLWTLFIFVFAIVISFILFKNNSILLNFKLSLIIFCSLIIAFNFKPFINITTLNEENNFSLYVFLHQLLKTLIYWCFWEKLIVLKKIIWYRQDISSI